MVEHAPVLGPMEAFRGQEFPHPQSNDESLRSPLPISAMPVRYPAKWDVGEASHYTVDTGLPRSPVCETPPFPLPPSPVSDRPLPTTDF